MTESQSAQQIQQWLLQDHTRLSALKVVAELALPECYIAAGFVRNLVWDRLHGHSKDTPLNDIDVIYFDASHTDAQRDQQLETRLRQQLALPWSVKNQARMHLRNGDAAYLSTQDAIRYWCELQTAVAARWNPETESVELLSGFGLGCLFDGHISLNLLRPKYYDFFKRINQRRWLSQWPALSVETESANATP